MSFWFGEFSKGEIGVVCISGKECLRKKSQTNACQGKAMTSINNGFLLSSNTGILNLVYIQWIEASMAFY